MTGAGCSTLDLSAATDLNNGAYAEAAKFASGLGEPLNVGAVMFFVNRAPTTGTSGDGGSDAGGGTCAGEFSGPECASAPANELTTLATAAQEALSKDGLQTFYVVLSNDNSSTNTPPLCFYQQVAQMAGQPNMVIDATQPLAMAQEAVQNFAGVATGLGTCVYELPPGVDTSAKVSFTIPIATPPTTTTAPVPVPIPFAQGCNAAAQSSDAGTAPDGWNIDGNHIRICGNSCSNLQHTVEAVTAITLSGDAGTSGAAAVPEVPVTVTMSCANSSGS